MGALEWHTPWYFESSDGWFLVRTVVYGSDTRCNLLCLEEQDGAVTEIEVDKMLRFWTGSAYALRLVSFARWQLPCVTKLPKFRPTTQCHVAPLRESNCFLVRFASYRRNIGDRGLLS